MKRLARMTWSYRSVGKVLVACAVTLGVAVYLDPSRSLGWLGRMFIVEDVIDSVDGIVVLMGGQRTDRVEKALDLFRRGVSPHIVFGSGYHRSSSPIYLLSDTVTWIPAGVDYLRFLEERNVPPEAIRVVPTTRVVDTATELESIKDWARNQGYRKVALVSSPFHTARVKYIWERLSSDIEATVVPSDRPEYQAWWSCPECRHQLLYELGAWVKEGARQLGSLVKK
jgi:uncharacterized SAM-binding protein YcdF (DUF218 family)